MRSLLFSYGVSTYRDRRGEEMKGEGKAQFTHVSLQSQMGIGDEVRERGGRGLSVGHVSVTPLTARLANTSPLTAGAGAGAGAAVQLAPHVPNIARAAAAEQRWVTAAAYNSSQNVSQ